MFFLYRIMLSSEGHWRNDLLKGLIKKKRHIYIYDEGAINY